MPVEFRFKELYFKKIEQEKRVISQAEIAEFVGVSKQAVHLWLKDNAKSVRLDTLDKLCEFFNCEPGDLLVRVPDERSSIAS
jgi:putative transcriptional regulator